MAIRKITPIVTCVPWKPVIMKKHEPNCAAPHGLPQGRTPSMISLVHSKACIPTNVAPNAAVASIKAAVLTREARDQRRKTRPPPPAPAGGGRRIGRKGGGGGGGGGFCPPQILRAK